MNIRLQPQQETLLVEIADRRGMTKEELAGQIIRRYLDEDKVSLEPAVDDRGGLGTELAAVFPKHGRNFAIESAFESLPNAAGLRPADSRGRLSLHKSSRKPRRKRA